MRSHLSEKEGSCDRFFLTSKTKILCHLRPINTSNYLVLFTGIPSTYEISEKAICSTSYYYLEILFFIQGHEIRLLAIWTKSLATVLFSPACSH